MRSRRSLAAILVAAVAVLLAPVSVVAHSQLVSSSPRDGDTLAAAPVQIVGDFSEPVDASKSSMELRGPDGSVIAKGTVPDGGPATRMVVTGFAALAAGSYEVRWTTVTADDGGVERGTFGFTLLAATGAPPASSPPGSSPSPAGTAATSAAPGQQTGSNAGIGDVLVPVAALALVLVLGSAWLLRRRR